MTILKMLFGGDKSFDVSGKQKNGFIVTISVTEIAKQSIAVTLKLTKESQKANF